MDHVTIERYASDLDANLERLSEALRNGTYRPQAIRRHYIPKPGSQEMRPLGIPTVQDRVVQTALRMVLEPIFERDFAAQSYGFRPGIGCKDALRRVDELLKAGYVHVVDADLKSYFDTIPKDRLLALVAGKVADGRILALVEAFLGQSVLEDTWEWVPEQGTPQGAVIIAAAEQHLPRPAGPSDGGEGLRDGAVCGRLRGAVPKPAGSRRGVGRGAAMDGAGRPDAASGEDAAGARLERWVRLPRVSLRAGHVTGRARRAWGSSRTRSGRRPSGRVGQALPE